MNSTYHLAAHKSLLYNECLAEYSDNHVPIGNFPVRFSFGVVSNHSRRTLHLSDLQIEIKPSVPGLSRVTVPV